MQLKADLQGDVATPPHLSNTSFHFSLKSLGVNSSYYGCIKFHIVIYFYETTQKVEKWTDSKWCNTPKIVTNPKGMDCSERNARTLAEHINVDLCIENSSSLINYLTKLKQKPLKRIIILYLQKKRIMIIIRGPFFFFQLPKLTVVNSSESLEILAYYI